MGEGFDPQAARAEIIRLQELRRTEGLDDAEEALLAQLIGQMVERPRTLPDADIVSITQGRKRA